MKISDFIDLEYTANALGCEILICGPWRALKALKALKRPKMRYKLGDHFVTKRKNRDMKISRFVDLD